ncbi:type IV fimbrial biogenesis protein FimT [Neorhodopirellula lusitana]|uniref:Type II secretion system protein H n=1 Tax=Neorhodopirellula lusitana TaxID=445327 RepID=A0ABY1QGY7_9BACT|nr:GspH/FimT family pseudopilin [Neorhodopirellula lusitana]SMP70423.1 type IV fimbrial biogenesis protein FimT [Neorhodopirellula lusitana]
MAGITSTNVRCSRQSRQAFGNSPRRGFSIVELSVVLVIVAIGVTLALPRFTASSTRRQVELVAQTIQADLELARRTAMNRGRPVTIQFDWTTASYRSDDIFIDDNEDQTLDLNLGESFGSDIDLSANFQDQPGILFNRDGTATMTRQNGQTSRKGDITVSIDGIRVHLQLRPGVSLVTTRGRNE